jgi:hypothetical protein
MAQVTAYETLVMPPQGTPDPELDDLIKLL